MNLKISEIKKDGPKKGDLVITNYGARLIVYDVDTEKYSLMDIETSNISTDWYYDLTSLLDGLVIKRIIASEDLTLEVK